MTIKEHGHGTSCWGSSQEGVGQHQENNSDNCLVCGNKLDYLESGREFSCIYCGKKEIGYVCCPNGHYVCDQCHGKDSYEKILNLALTAQGANPLEIAETMMKSAPIPMLGCEHAWIAAGSLLAAIKNSGEIKISESQIAEALSRTRKQAIGAYCGLTGVCGVSVAIGAAFSVILGAACPKDQETAKTMKVVGKVVNVIANQTGPCCCKNFVRTALNIATDSVKEFLNVSLPEPAEEIFCSDSDRHPHGCRKEKCSYFKKSDTPRDSKAEIVNDQSLNKFDYLVNKAVELGVEAVKVIDSGTIAVADWVQWKCQYGCPFYDKDSLHPPLAPDAETTRRVIKEYDKALLINGSNGPQLSQQAIKIEHAAYSMGFYKAFALLALPFGDSPS